MTIFGKLAWGYLALISLISIWICCSDKRRSKKDGERRVPERTLLILSAFGGSVAMLVTMLLIRHKTKHPKFMVGLPIIIILQYAVVWFVCINLLGDNSFLS